jgi:hypothetical protein
MPSTAKLCGGVAAARHRPLTACKADAHELVGLGAQLALPCLSGHLEHANSSLPRAAVLSGGARDCLLAGAKHN